MLQATFANVCKWLTAAACNFRQLFKAFCSVPLLQCFVWAKNLTRIFSLFVLTNENFCCLPKSLLINFNKLLMPMLQLKSYLWALIFALSRAQMQDYCPLQTSRRNLNKAIFLATVWLMLHWLAGKIIRTLIRTIDLLFE